jgi:threonine synthase
MGTHMNQHLLGFHCTLCGATYAPDEVQYTCPCDGGNLDAQYDYAAIARAVDPSSVAHSADRSVWHYAALLPECISGAAASPTPLSSFGWSPLYRAAAIERELGLHAPRAVWLKDDSRLPSSSFKDRASSMVIARALQMGVQTICAASTGNAASSLATLCAGTSLNTVIFVPHSTPEGKLAQILAHGARVYAVSGSYDDAFELAQQASRAFGWYNRNTGYNPFTREGKKTAAFEIGEQLARLPSPRPASASLRASSPAGERERAFRAPDVVVVPVGDGNIISGLHKGFRDLAGVGWIEKMPRFVGVTATLAPALYRAWQAGGEAIALAPSSTIAGGISVDLPRDGVMALRAVRDSGGVFVEAGDDEMLEAMMVLARQAGVFVEPASAAAYVGLRKAVQLGAIHPDDEVVLQLTGSGLKDTRSALAAAGAAPGAGVVRIEGTIEEIRHH